MNKFSTCRKALKNIFDIFLGGFAPYQNKNIQELGIFLGLVDLNRNRLELTAFQKNLFIFACYFAILFRTFRIFHINLTTSEEEGGRTAYS